MALTGDADAEDSIAKKNLEIGKTILLGNVFIFLSFIYKSRNVFVHKLAHWQLGQTLLVN